MERKELEFFISDSDDKHEDGDSELFCIERGNMVIVGTEVHIEGQKIIYYIAPSSNTTGLLFFYIGDDTFDNFIENLDEYNEESAWKTWPLLMHALSNGVNDNYSNIALARIDNGLFKFWGTFVNVENIDFNNLDTEYIGEKAGSLLSITCNMLSEYIEKDISTWQNLKEITKRGSDIFRTARTIFNIGSILLGAGSIDNDY